MDFLLLFGRFANGSGVGMVALATRVSLAGLQHSVPTQRALVYCDVGTPRTHLESRLC